MSLMTMGAASWRRPGGPAPGAGFSGAIAALNPEIWMRMNELSGSVATNMGSIAEDGTYAVGVALDSGNLTDGEAQGNSVLLPNPTAYVLGPSYTPAVGFTGVIGVVYAGTGDGSSSVRILWRASAGTVGGSYIRIDQTNIAIQIPGSGAVSTGVASSVLKDGNPHFVMVGILSDDPTNFHMWIDGQLAWTYALGSTSWHVEQVWVGRNGGSNAVLYGRYADYFQIRGAVTTVQAGSINDAWSPA